MRSGSSSLDLRKKRVEAVDSSCVGVPDVTTCGTTSLTLAAQQLSCVVIPYRVRRAKWPKSATRGVSAQQQDLNRQIAAGPRNWKNAAPSRHASDRCKDCDAASTL